MHANRWILWGALLSVPLTGCQSMNLNTNSNLNAEAQSAAATAPTDASYFCEVHSDWFGTKSNTKPFQEGMTVQDAVEQSGALLTMRAIEIDLIRREGNRLVRMPSDYNVSKRHVDFSQDYALRANDRVIIRPKKSNVLGSALKALGGPPLR